MMSGLPSPFTSARWGSDGTSAMYVTVGLKVPSPLPIKTKRLGPMFGGLPVTVVETTSGMLSPLVSPVVRYSPTLDAIRVGLLKVPSPLPVARYRSDSSGLLDEAVLIA